MKNKLIAVALATMLILPIVVIVGRAASNTHTGPCSPDIQKFCADVKQGGGRIAECLKAHHPDLSTACKDKMTQVKKAVKEAHNECVGDVQKFCSNVKEGHGRIIHCLRSHQSELSSQCQSAMVNAKELRQKNNSSAK